MKRAVAVLTAALVVSGCSSNSESNYIQDIQDSGYVVEEHMVDPLLLLGYTMCDSTNPEIIAFELGMSFDETMVVMESANDNLC